MTHNGNIRQAERNGALILIAMVWFLVGLLYNLPPYLHLGHLGIGDLFGQLLVCFTGAILSLSLFPLISRSRSRSRYIRLGLVSFAITMMAALLSAIDIAVFDSVAAWLETTPRPHAYSVRWTSNFAIFVSQFALIAAIIWVIQYGADRRADEAELALARTSAAQASEAAHAARLSALRYQLNPHFLFNTMNAISSLVITQRNVQAEEMLGRLSEFLRMTLTADPQARQTLDGELETVQAYLDIERIRFGDRLAVDVDCPCELRDATLPAFLLQPLVENAIKHGVAESDDVVTIRIEATTDADSLVVIVEDDGGSRDSDRSHEGCGSPGTGVGLRNVEARLDALYGSRGHLEIVRRESGFLAIVRLPLDLGQVAAA